MNEAELIDFQLDRTHRVDVNGTIMKPGDIVIRKDNMTGSLKPFLYFGKVFMAEYSKTLHMSVIKKQLFLGSQSFQIEDEDSSKVFVLPESAGRQVLDEYDKNREYLLDFIKYYNKSMTLKLMMKRGSGKSLFFNIIDQEDMRFNEIDGWMQVPDTCSIDLANAHIFSVPVYDTGGYKVVSQVVYSTFSEENFETKITRRKLNKFNNDLTKVGYLNRDDEKFLYTVWMFCKDKKREISIEGCIRKGLAMLIDLHDDLMK